MTVVNVLAGISMISTVAVMCVRHGRRTRVPRVLRVFVHEGIGRLLCMTSDKSAAESYRSLIESSEPEPLTRRRDNLRDTFVRHFFHKTFTIVGVFKLFVIATIRLATANGSRVSICVTKALPGRGVVDPVKIFSHLVWSPCQTWMLFLVPCVRM